MLAIAGDDIAVNVQAVRVAAGYAVADGNIRINGTVQQWAAGVLAQRERTC